MKSASTSGQFILIEFFYYWVNILHIFYLQIFKSFHWSTNRSTIFIEVWKEIIYIIAVQIFKFFFSVLNLFLSYPILQNIFLLRRFPLLLELRLPLYPIIFRLQFMTMNLSFILFHFLSEDRSNFYVCHLVMTNDRLTISMLELMVI